MTDCLYAVNVRYSYWQVLGFLEAIQPLGEG
jgi:hypothetical protein